MSRRAGGTLPGIVLLGVFLTGGLAGAAELYQGRGVVLAIDSELNMILIRHEEIPGSMHPMTMLFRFEPRGLVGGIREGDRILFTVKRSGDDVLVVDLKRAGDQ